MSEAVTDDTDALAAEYVLGTLDSEERSQAQALLGADEGFVAKVKVWERRLGELHLMVEPVEPDGKIWERIKVKIPDLQPAPGVNLSEPSTQEMVPAAAPGATGDAATFWSLDEVTPGAPDAAGISPPGGTSAETPVKPIEVGPTLVVPALDQAPTLSTALLPPVRNPLLIEAREETAAIARRLGRWRAFAILMTVVVAAIAALLAAWRFVPDRLPALLRPAALIGLMGAPNNAAAPTPSTPSPSASSQPAPSPVRRPAPAESQFDE
jgi:hypothetical protein